MHYTHISVNDIFTEICAFGGGFSKVHRLYVCNFYSEENFFCKLNCINPKSTILCVLTNVKIHGINLKIKT